MSNSEHLFHVQHLYMYPFSLASENTCGKLIPDSSLFQVSLFCKNYMNGRALNDFETAENNELALRAGEVIVVSDFSRVNW